MTVSGRDEIPVIVLVHLGTTPAPWLRWNIFYIQSNFSNSIVVVSDNLELLRQIESPTVGVFFWSSKYRLQEFRDGSSFELSNFWNGFWIFSALRFEALSALHSEIPNSTLFHLESDVLLHPSLHLETICSEIQGVAAARLGFGRSGAAILISRNPDFTALLATETVDWLRSSRGGNEMHALDHFRLMHSQLWTTIPTFFSMDASYFNDGASSEDRVSVSENAGRFGGIFDVAGIGQYLFGTDARMNRGVRKLRNVFSDQFLNVGSLKFQADEFGWPQVVNDQLLVPIRSLHIHSKDKRVFSSVLPNAFIKKRVEQWHLLPKNEWDARALGLALANRFSRNRGG